MIKKSF